MIKLSIVVTNYNKGEWINFVTQQLFLQKHPEVEIIFIDDCSTDDSCYNLAWSYDRQIIHTENIGIGRTRQEGINISQGEYIAFIDGDDFVDMQYIGTILKHISSRHNIYQFFYLSFPTGERFTEDEIVVWNRVYQKSFLLKHNIQFTDRRNGEDYYFNQECLKHNPTIAIIPQVLYYYNMASTNTLTR